MIYINYALILLAIGAMLGAVVLVATAIGRGKGRRRRPLRGAFYCLAAFVGLYAINFAFVYLVLASRA